MPCIAYTMGNAYTVGVADESVNTVGNSLLELGKLATREREVTSEQEQLRAKIEEIVRTQLLAGHPPRGRVGDVERASGYSREWVRRLRAGTTNWRRQDPR